MLGLVVRAAELPISLSLQIARKGAVLAGRVAGWAVTGLVRELSPDGGTSPQSVADERPAAEPVFDEPPAAEDAIDGEAASEEPIAPDAAPEMPPGADDAVPPGAPTTEQGAPAASGVEEAAEPPIGGEDGAVVEHEPGLGTSVRARTPHSKLNNPVTDPDMTEWPDPYDHREDPLDPGVDMVFGGEDAHTQTGATSTSEPHPSRDPEAEPWEGPKRDKVDQ
jgi:hypothetical protein